MRAHLWGKRKEVVLSYATLGPLKQAMAVWFLRGLINAQRTPNGYKNTHSLSFNEPVWGTLSISRPAFKRHVGSLSHGGDNQDARRAWALEPDWMSRNADALTPAPGKVQMRRRQMYLHLWISSSIRRVSTSYSWRIFQGVTLKADLSTAKHSKNISFRWQHSGYHPEDYFRCML